MTESFTCRCVKAATAAPNELAEVAGRTPFQSMTCLTKAAWFPRFASIGWDKLACVVFLYCQPPAAARAFVVTRGCWRPWMVWVRVLRWDGGSVPLSPQTTNYPC